MGGPRYEPEPDDDDISGSEDGDDSDEDGQWFGSQAEADDAGGPTDFDDMQGMAVSPFGPETFESAAACWAHAASAHGFSLARLRAEVGAEVWTDYHRIRLVNYLRSLGPQKARAEAPKLSAQSPIWTDDSLLLPVLDDDVLLFEDDGEGIAFDEAAVDIPGGAGGRPAGGPGVSAEDPEEELVRLRATVAHLRGMLAGDADDDEDAALQAAVATARAAHRGAAPGAAQSSSSRSAPEPPAEGDAAGDVGDDAGAAAEVARARALVTDRHQVEAFRQFVEQAAVQGQTVLNASCGVGVLSCLCAQMGAKVISVDASRPALALHRRLAAANGLERQVTVLHGSADDRPGSEDGPSSSSSSAPGVLPGRLACDGLVSERLLGEPRLSPLVPALLSARCRHLRPGGWVFPQRLSLSVVAVDYADVAHHREGWHQCASLGGLDLSLLGAELAPPQAETVRGLPERRLASAAPPAELFALDALTARPEDSLPPRAPFRLQLRPGRCLTALGLKLELGPVPPGAVPGALPGALPAEELYTVLHLPAPGVQEPRCLRLPGADYATVEGQFSASWASDGERLVVSVELLARSANRGDVRAGATFLLA